MSVGMIVEQTRRAPKLSEVLFDGPTRNFASIAALPSNVQAIEAALLFSTGSLKFLTLVGPSGWGKSHTLEAVACRISHDAGVPPRVFSAQEWIDAGARADIPGALILDNVQDLLEGPRTRTSLRIALERRTRGSKATLLSFTAPKLTRPIRTLLPSPREWAIGVMAAPHPIERSLVLDQMAASEGMHLCPMLTKLIAGKMKGNGRTLMGALKRLKLGGTQWIEPRQVLRACGILDPFFSDNSGWDLADRVLKVAEEPEFLEAPGLVDLALYTLLRIAGLSEAAVARTFGVAPAEAYAMSERFHTSLENEGVRQQCTRFVESIVECLLND